LQPVAAENQEEGNMAVPSWSKCKHAIAATAVLLLSAGYAMAQDTGIPGVDQALLDAAKAEGTVTVYCTQDQDIATATANAFQKAVPGISVRVLRLASTQLNSRLVAEVQSGVNEDDVFCSPDLSVYTDHPDWWIPLTPDIIPAISKLPQRAVNSQYILLAQGVVLLAYNTSLVPEGTAPKTWEDVLKPEYKGKGLLVDPRNSTTYISWLDYMDKKYGDDFVKKLRDQNFQIVSAGSPAVQEVAAGGADFAFPVTRSHIIPVIAKKAPVDAVAPWENDPSIEATGSEQGFGLYAKAQHPNAAKVYLNWLLTPEAQKINCGGAYASFILPDDDRGNCPTFAKEIIGVQYLSDERRQELLGLLGLQ
jgi:iron(III) transport system substrate-binding protein